MYYKNHVFKLGVRRTNTPDANFAAPISTFRYHIYKFILGFIFFFYFEYHTKISLKKQEVHRTFSVHPHQ